MMSSGWRRMLAVGVALAAAWTGARTQASLVTGQQTFDMSLSGYVYADVNNDGLMNEWESPIRGCTIELNGIAEDEAAIERTVKTNSRGYYEFDGLAIGSYSITQIQPSMYIDGKDAKGNIACDYTNGGKNGNDCFSNIALGALGGPQYGSDFNFGEWGLKPQYISKRRFIVPDPEPVPEPAAAVLLACGGLSLVCLRRQRLSRN